MLSPQFKPVLVVISILGLLLIWIPQTDQASPDGVGNGGLQEDTPGQATCEGEGFLPLITIVSAALVRSIRDWMEDGTKRNWNVSPASAESF